METGGLLLVLLLIDFVKCKLKGRQSTAQQMLSVCYRSEAGSTEKLERVMECVRSNKQGQASILRLELNSEEVSFTTAITPDESRSIHEIAADLQGIDKDISISIHDLKPVW